MNQSEEDDFKIELKTSQAQRTYFVTYSQADLSKFPTRQSFGEQVVAYFNAGLGKVEVEHWACCQESHDYHGRGTLSPIIKTKRAKTVETGEGKTKGRPRRCCQLFGWSR